MGPPQAAGWSSGTRSTAPVKCPGRLWHNGAHRLARAVTEEGQFSSPPLFDMAVLEVARYLVSVAWLQFPHRFVEGVGNIGGCPATAYRAAV